MSHLRDLRDKLQRELSEVNQRLCDVTRAMANATLTLRPESVDLAEEHGVRWCGVLNVPGSDLDANEINSRVGESGCLSAGASATSPDAFSVNVRVMKGVTLRTLREWVIEHNVTVKFDRLTLHATAARMREVVDKMISLNEEV